MAGAGATKTLVSSAGAQESERLALLLAEASHALVDAGLEPPAVLERLCGLVVPGLGNACVVRLLSEDGEWLHLKSSAHADPELRALLHSQFSFPLSATREPLAGILGAGRPLLLTDDTGAKQLQEVLLPRLRSALEQLTITSTLMLPLRARQHILGTLTVFRQGEVPSFGPAETILLQELADRAGLALDVARAYEAERQARHVAEVAANRLARLHRIAEAFGEAVTSADMARVVVEEIINALGADRALIVLPAADDPGQLELVNSRGLPEDVLQRFARIPVNAPVPIAAAYRTGTPVWLESLEALTTTFPETVIHPQLPQAMVSLPLITRGRVLGAIGFGFDAPRTFHPDERTLMQDLARQSTQALERTQLYEAEQRARTRAERVAARNARLQTVTATLSQALTAARVAEVVIDQGVAALEAQAGGLWLVDDTGTYAQLLRSVGYPQTLVKRLGFVPLHQEAPLVDAIRHEQPVWLESREEFALRYPRVQPHAREVLPEPIASQACLPLLVNGHALGALLFGFHAVHRFDQDERIFLTLLAHHAAQALERARLFEQERRAREALREAHHALEAIVQASPAAIVLLEPDGTVHLWNPAAERTFGWAAIEVLGRGLPTVLEEHREAFHAELTRVARGEALLGVETRCWRRDGSLIDVALWATAIREANGRLQCLAMFVDITERKRAEKAQRFLSEASSVLASSLDHEVTLGRVAHLAVPAYAEGCQVYLRAEDGEVGRVAAAPAEEAVALPQPLAPEPSAVQRVIASGSSELRTDCAGALPAPGGPPLPHGQAAKSYLCVPLLVRDQVMGALSFVTSQRNYDAQDLALAQELARRAALALDNARHYREARTAIRLREEFLSIASHELKTPISALQLQVQSLLDTFTRNPAGPPPDRLRRGLEMVDRQVRRQVQLVNDLLDVSRISSGRLELRPESLDLAGLAREVAERFEPELVRTGSLLTLHAPAPVSGQWDRMRLDQVVTNLISNAVKYGRGNPVQLTVESRQEGARLTVRDGGIGIAHEHLARVFDRFERAVSERNYGGFGLGLWISRQIVEAMGGRITVTSDLDVGSTFIVELPW